MVTILKKQSGSLAYLEQVRQHMARLPSIDPSTRSLILTGYPNVGKSSFMNKVTRANVDVQPYPFTTKSIFVGHTDYKYLSWQVLDTPGILDHPLEDRNTIEMLAITALAHLRACVLFMIDISEHCGYSLQQQVDLFKNIKPLFTGKPLLIVLTKIDLLRYDDLSKEQKDLLESIATDDVEMIGLSNVTEEGIAQVKQTACDILLQFRVESKLGKGGKRVEDILNKVHLAQPQKRDDIEREITVPDSVQERRRKIANGEALTEMELDRLLEKDLEEQGGGVGVYGPDFQKHYDLKTNEWKYDMVPEIMDGKNIADFIDPEILKKLEELEKEEEEYNTVEDPDLDYGTEDVYVSEDDENMYNTIQKKIELINIKRRINKTANRSKVPLKYRGTDINAIAEELVSRGVDREVVERAKERVTSKSRSRSQKAAEEEAASRARTVSIERGRAESKMRGESILGKRKRLISESRDRVQSATSKFAGIRNIREQVRFAESERKRQRTLAPTAKKGESDRVIYSEKPKHLNTGIRSFSADRR